MKASELRIGNLIEHNGVGCIFVFSVTNQMDDIERINDITSSGFTPITLTEEWLLKLGFDDYGKDSFNVHRFEKNDVRIERAFRSRAYYCINVSIGGLGDINLKYVHQLQNLYFALIGEELKIKDDE